MNSYPLARRPCLGKSACHLEGLCCGLGFAAFGVRRLELLGEGAPDAFFAGAIFLCEGFHKRADADTLVEVGIVGVRAGPDVIDDLVA